MGEASVSLKDLMEDRSTQFIINLERSGTGKVKFILKLTKKKQSSILKGFMHKRGNLANMAWQSRYYVLKQSGLYWHEGRESRNWTKGFIGDLDKSFTKVSVIPTHSNWFKENKGCFFSVITQEKTYDLRVKGDHELVTWLKALQGVGCIQQGVPPPGMTIPVTKPPRESASTLKTSGGDQPQPIKRVGNAVPPIKTTREVSDTRVAEVKPSEKGAPIGVPRTSGHIREGNGLEMKVNNKERGESVDRKNRFLVGSESPKEERGLMPETPEVNIIDLDSPFMD